MEKTLKLKYALVADENLVFLFDDIQEQDDYFFVLRNGKRGVLKKDGSIILDWEWEHIYCWHGYFLVRNSEKYGVYSKDGSVILNAEWDKIEKWADCFRVCKDKKYGICSFDGSVILWHDGSISSVLKTIKKRRIH